VATFTYPTATASYNGGQPAVGRDVRDDLDEVRTFIVGKNLEGGNIQDATVDLVNLTAAVIQALVPTGSLLPFSAATEPAGWLICDGRAVSRTTFAALNTLMAAQSPAYPYGDGDMSTTFNLPDLRGRIPIGSNNAGLPNGADGARTTRDLADEEGSEDKTLTIGNLPSHDHAVGSHTHKMFTNDNLTGTSLRNGDGSVPAESAATGDVDYIMRQDASLTATLGDTGASRSSSVSKTPARTKHW